MEAPKTGIVVDGSTRGNPGPSEYRGLDLETGKVLFHKKIGISTNNITEFIALGHAVLLSLQQSEITIYSDSQTALSWLKKKSVNTELPISDKTKISQDYCDRILSKVKDLHIEFNGIDLIINNNITVSKWYSSEYGEIPADFGYKL